KDFNALNVLGAILYRAGQFDKALQRLNEAAAVFQPDDQARGTILYSWAFLAMTHHKLGHTEQARQWLGKAIEKIDSIMKQSSPSLKWNRKLTLQLLRHEAETLIHGKATGPRK